MSDAELGGGIVVLIALLVLYFLPTIIATRRKAKNRGWIFLLNLFFGATGAGWIGALVWACCSEPIPTVIVRYEPEMSDMPPPRKRPTIVRYKGEE